MDNVLPQDLITYTEARRLLGVSTATLTKILKNGIIRHFSDPLDQRKKLVSRSEAMALKIPKSEAA